MIDQNGTTCVLKARFPAPRRPLGTILACGILVAPAAWLLRVDPSIDVRVTWAVIVFFGGCGVLYALMWALCLRLPAQPALRLDENRVTFLRRIPVERLPFVGRFLGTNPSLRWSDIVGFTIIDLTASLQSFAAKGAKMRIVGLITRDLDSMRGENGLQRNLRVLSNANSARFPRHFSLKSLLTTCCYSCSAIIWKHSAERSMSTGV